MSLPLRKCVHCGLEAWSLEDLVKFSKCKTSKYERRNSCKKCESKYVSMRNKKNPLKIRYKIMMDRCYNPNVFGYPYYGSRGIAVCDEWRKDRQVFIDWARSHGFTPELTLDRIDNDRGYFPENCRWATHTQQMRNMRSNTTDFEKLTRVCGYCHQEKPLSEFNSDSSRPLGTSYCCRKCQSERAKEYYRRKKLRTKNLITPN